MDVSTAAASSFFGLDEPICPYTGLRTFTEAEAIYFRGRESHIAKCLALLVEQRFVMITGASGDGKSSLVFAGMLPEVRAGFVPARHSRWAVATFRPERSPLRNLAEALAPALRLPSSRSVETELKRGFSSLVQLYQTSELCPPATLPQGLTPTEQEQWQRQQQRQAANLLLVVDQFEEFFTNPENYDGDQPNSAAQTVVNLLLETVRLAQAQNLPIYIVCTMRSDFVGQCAEFRGLIEQVGASQYFVPRLLRHEFQEVIKGPALLSGNRISERLVQRLLYDIGQGQDQLPVLQHALRRIWLAADEGREEMDLLHYAMVGGLSDELPAADRARFAAWRATLPAHQQQFLLANPGLRNVLDAHANQLYFESNDLYNRGFEPPLPPGTAERVIEQTFRVLTRTDGKRVVRNRVTGAQITAILDDEASPWPVVCRILRPFRAEGTTFMAPFLKDGDDDHAVLPPDTVLDISHESLIRNWNLLTEWARNEAEDVRMADDFKQQAGRWKEKGEDRGYLLPIGPYKLFSDWHAAKKGVNNWLAYYQGTNPDASLGQGPVASQIGLLTRYLETSRRHLWSALLAARYGVWRLTATILLPILLLVGGLWWWTYRKVESDHVAAVLMRNGLDELSTTTLPIKDRARFLLTVDRLKDHLPWFNFRPEAHYSFPKALDQLNNDTLALDIELNMYGCADNSDYDLLERESPYSQAILRDIQVRLAQAGNIAQPANGQAGLSEPQRRRAVLMARYIMALSYYLVCDSLSRPKFLPDPAVHKEERARFAQTRQQLLGKLRDYVRQEIQTTTGRAPSAAAFGFCLRVLLGQGTDSQADLAFLDGMSPFEPGSARQFQRLFPTNKATDDEITSLRLNSGGYMAAAMAFAARQNLPQVQKCLAVLRAGGFTAFWHEDSSIALMPYLIKYKLLTPENARDLLYECAKTSGVEFDEVYAATVYSLLSVKPVQTVFDVNPSSFDISSNVQMGGIHPRYLNANRVSFSLPTAVRDSAWAALMGATPKIARRDTIFENPTADDTKRNELFLSAFLAKMHGLYLAEIKRQPTEAQQSFARFSRLLEELQKQPETGHQVWACHWGLYEYDNGEEGGVNVEGPNMAHPVTYLQLPIRPKTLKYAAYYTCSFDAFFDYELQYVATRDRRTVQLFDSIAFMEAEFPDRFSNEYYTSTSDPLLQSAQYAPNLNWLKAIAKVTVPGDMARTQRNATLLTIEEAVQNHEQLRDSVFTKKLVAELRQFARQLKAGAAAPIPLMNEALAVAYSDLATAMAHEGQVAEAYALAEAIDFAPTPAVYCNYSLASATKVRISEQIMLTNNIGAKPLLDAFLKQYLKENQAGHINLDKMQPTPNVAASILPVCFWRPTDTGQPDSISSISPSMTYTLDNEQLMTGLYAPFKGYGLAGKLNRARYEMENSPFRLEPSIRMLNYILLGYAHAVTYKLNDGWREYDETELTLPSNYSGHQQR